MAKSEPESRTDSRDTSDMPERCPRILVVDDIQDNLDLIADTFTGEPWDVRTTDNAKDAWAQMKRWQPDLVLLDIHMPEFNGHHLCTAIRLKPEFDGVPVVFLTAERTSKKDIERGLAMGAADYLCKPIDGATLRERVRSVLEGHARTPGRSDMRPPQGGAR